MSDSSLPTVDGPVRPQPRRDKSARFLPGMILAGRYRIVAPLGRGGMGEVYRADDMKLGQPVALKFLPVSLNGDPARRERLLDEVRLARQVAHPNVCRVWDVGEVDSHDFLAMEYVDGEDLSSLLRRIGRLPEDRAVRMSRELCAGLAAVHDEGILHRDLKPANVMVDGRGRVKLADFGLASVEAETDGADTRSGTPAYMAPEQLEGREVSVRSDVYALGLVLYELFTGHSAYPAKTMEEATHRSETPLSRPSSHVQGLDPAIERAIERCLETDPSLRPASAGAVAASLPGGDPLAAALAAGETPSPELVAAAGGTGGLRLPVAFAVLATIGLGLGAVAWLADRAMPYLADLEKPTEVLIHEARQILQEHGSSREPADGAHGFVVDEDGTGGARLVFWYRESPSSLTEGQTLTDPGLSFSNPAPIVPGMAGVRLDAQGRLIELLRVPSASDPEGHPPGWPALLGRTGVDPEAWEATEPRTIPPVFADERLAWEFSDGAHPPLFAEGASIAGWPVHLRVRPRDRIGPAPDRSGVFQFIYVVLLILALAAIVARRNLRLGRVDHTGARRVAAIGAFVSVVGFMLLGNPRVLDPVQLFMGIMISTFFTAVFWLVYLALEPVVRRRWPDTLASWTRLLSGRFFDPLLGRDLLLGVLGGVALALLELTGRALTELSSVQFSVPPELLLGGWAAAGGVVRSISSVLPAFILLLLLAVLRQLLRATWAAVLLTLAIGGLMFGDFTSLSGVVVSLAFVGLTIAILIRLGLLAAAVALTVHHLLAHAFMTTHLTAWYADSAVAGILVTLALAGWGFYTGTLRLGGVARSAR